jgi:hypothetical protein
MEKDTVYAVYCFDTESESQFICAIYELEEDAIKRCDLEMKSLENTGFVCEYKVMEIQ